MTCIPNPLASTAVARPEHVVLKSAGIVLTARALVQAVRRCAADLAQAGVGPHARVALLAPSSLDFVVTLHALGWLGAVACPLYSKAPGPEAVRQMEQLRVEWLLLDATMMPSLHAELRQAVGVGVKILEIGGNVSEMGVNLSDVGVNASEVEVNGPAERFWPLEETRLILLSSGSTGVPHAVPLTTAQLLFSAFGSATRLGHHLDDCWLGCLPLHHVGGLSILFRAAWFGTTVELPTSFDAQAIGARLDSGEIALTAVVPRMLEKILATRGATAFPAALRAVLLGGAPASAQLLATCRCLELPVCVTWGMTETASQVATAWPGEIGPQGACGPPLPFARVSVDAGKLRGRLTVCGPVVGPKPLLSGDCGELDHRGWVHVWGRDDDIIISGGENIAPFEVESVLLACPGIADAAVVGVVDAHWGQRPVAVVVAQGNSILDDATLVAWCRGRLASFKVPAQFVWCRALPRDALGKLRRKQILPLLQRGVTDV